MNEKFSIEVENKNVILSENEFVKDQANFFIVLVFSISFSFPCQNKNPTNWWRDVAAPPPSYVCKAVGGYVPSCLWVIHMVFLVIYLFLHNNLFY